MLFSQYINVFNQGSKTEDIDRLTDRRDYYGGTALCRIVHGAVKCIYTVVSGWALMFILLFYVICRFIQVQVDIIRGSIRLFPKKTLLLESFQSVSLTN